MSMKAGPAESGGDEEEKASGLKDPVVVYEAVNNLDGTLIVDRLTAHDIPAVLIEDQTHAAFKVLGANDINVKPRIYTERHAAETASGLITEYELQRAIRALPPQDQEQISVTCEDCGRETLFSGDLDGTIQQCSQCFSYVDVGGDEWDEAEYADDEGTREAPDAD